MAHNDLRGVVQRKLKKVHWQRIDVDGLPNLNGCHHGTEFWVHCLTTSDFHAKATQRLAGWICARGLKGGRVFAFIRSRRLWRGSRGIVEVDELWILSGQHFAELKGGLKRAKAIGVWAGAPKSWDWGEIGEVLCGYPGVD